MNSQFRSWTRSTAFTLNLCDWAIQELLLLDAKEKHSASGNWREDGCYMTGRGRVNYLVKRGLISAANSDGFWTLYRLTAAGRLVCGLLLEAGFKDESCYSDTTKEAVS